MKLTTNKHKIIIIISVIFINAFANAQALICDTIPIWSDVKIILCREQHFLKFKNTDEQGGYFVTFYDTINKSTIVIKRLTWNLIPSKYAKDIITNKINACDTTIIFGTYLNTNTNATNNFKQKIYPSFEISYWDVTDSLKTTYDSIINSISIFQTKEPIDTIRYDQSGDTTYVQRNASDTHFRAHYGNYVKETGQPDKIYNEEGYIALHGDSVSYHFFERDYLGSVRAVFDLYGNLEQANDYNVTGIPSIRHLGNADVHKHTGKEFQGFNGLAWYDNNARYYDPILGRFTSQDPLAEKYPWLSPYNHCANNPLKFVDRDGMRINFAKLQKYDLHTGTNMVDQIIGDLSIQTGLSLSIDDDGYLNYSSNSNGVPIVTSIGNQLTGSVTARSHLLKLIDSSDCLIIKPGARSKADPNAINEIGLSSKQIQQFIDGATNVDSKTLGFGMTFLHESFHTEMGGNLSDDFIGTGEVVDIMNQIRKELNQIGYNYGKRTNYTGINVNGSIYIPMDKSSLNKLNLGLTPDKDDQYIIFYP